MKRYKLWNYLLSILLGLLFGVGLSGGGVLPIGSAHLPNIIFLMTDQQRWDCLGVVNPHIRTPNLDRLAKQGILFRQAVCQAPMCVPSRYAMMFGLYPSQLGVYANSDSLPDSALPSRPLPQILRDAGYQTAGFGKTHWREAIPSTRGFEVRAIGEPRKSVAYEAGALMIDDDNLPGLQRYFAEVAKFGPGEEGVDGYIGSTTKIPLRDHRDGWVAEQCLKFLDHGVDPNRPLFLYLSFLKPHAGMNVPQEFEKLYDLNTIPDVPQPPWSEEPATHLAAYDADPQAGTRYQEWRTAWEKMTPLERRQTTLRYYANCSWLDTYFGQVLEKLKKLGRLDNTLIIFTADHGEMMGERNFRFSKYCLFDSSVRVPLILSGSLIPEAKRGMIDDRPAEHIDLVPTIMHVLGDGANPMLPGLDLLSEQQRTGSFSEFHGGVSDPYRLAPAYMWRKADWKLIQFLPGQLTNDACLTMPVKGELYHLTDDPHEWNNLYNDNKYGAVREQLKTELLMHLACAWGRGPFSTAQPVTPVHPKASPGSSHQKN